MLIDGNTIGVGAKFEAEVCILGGGVAGIVLARELSQHAVKVIVLESAGENYDQNKQDLYSPSKENSDSGYPDPSFSRLRMLGGSSNHWENNTSPLDPADFEKRPWIQGSGWPISYSDLVPFYPRAGEYVGVEADGYETEFWTEKLKSNNVVKESPLIDTGIAKAAQPPTRFYAKYGSELNASSSVTIISYANVVEVDYDTSNQKIDTVYFESTPGQRAQVTAKYFVMCFGGIENARMLLHFNEKYEDNLGNKFGNVGRYFMDHPVVRGAHFYAHDRDLFGLYGFNDLDTRFVVGFLKLREEALRQHELTNIRMPLLPATNYYLSDGISSHHIMQDAFGRGELPKDLGSHLMNFVKDIDMVAEAVTRKTFDGKLFDHADEIGGFQLSMMIEQTPDKDNQIKLGNDRDCYGIKKVVVEWVLRDDDKERFWRGLEVVAQSLGALELGRMRLLKEREDRIFGDQLSFGHHHSGTTRMSASEQEGVVDSAQKVFGTNNLFVAGSSVFPTIGHVPPTLTIAAMSIRLAEHLAKEVKDD